MMFKKEKLNSDLLYRLGDSDLMHITEEGETFDTIADKYLAVSDTSGISRQKFIEQIKMDNPRLRIWRPLIEPRQIMRIRYRDTGRFSTCKDAHDDLLTANDYFEILAPGEQRLIQDHSEALLHFEAFKEHLPHFTHAVAKEISIVMKDAEKDLLKLLKNYKDYKVGGVSKATYNKMRIVIRDAVQKKIGGIISEVTLQKPLAKIINLTPAIGKRASDILTQTGSLEDFEAFASQIEKLGKAAKFSKAVGVLGLAVDISFKSVEVLEAWDTGQKKWETTIGDSFEVGGGLFGARLGVGAAGILVALVPMTAGFSLIVLVVLAGVGAVGGGYGFGKLGQLMGRELDKPENQGLTYVDPYGISHTVDLNTVIYNSYLSILANPSPPVLGPQWRQGVR